MMRGNIGERSSWHLSANLFIYFKKTLYRQIHFDCDEQKKALIFETLRLRFTSSKASKD